ncbi:MAG: pirin family protein [Eggerthellaceae bacterium]|nr:pirin family protein [Eggerthellaceae bacterium]MDR2716254.1 pirin family protein [Coriobacteriaceae bacterium]
MDSTKMGRGQHGWLDSHFHFSFAEYYNPDNIQFGELRVLNDDVVQPGTGFDTHPHKDMEIITYVIEGELTHKDSMGNEHTLTRGQSQYMSAGTGITHSEHNWGSEPLRLIQTWVFPDKEGYTPAYGDYRFKFEDRYNTWLPIATGYDAKDSTAPIKVHADVNLYAAVLPQGGAIEFKVGKGRQAYLVLLEGKVAVRDIGLSTRDALEIVEEDVRITADEESHLYAIEMRVAEGFSY